MNFQNELCSSYELSTELDNILRSESRTTVFKLGVASTSTYFGMSCATMFIAEYLYTKHVGSGSCICLPDRSLRKRIHPTVYTEYEKWFQKLLAARIQIDTLRSFSDKIRWGKMCVASIQEHLHRLGYDVSCYFVYKNLPSFQDFFEDVKRRDTSSNDTLQDKLNARLEDPFWLTTLQDILAELKVPPPDEPQDDEAPKTKPPGTNRRPSHRKNKAKPMTRKPRRKRRRTASRQRNDDHFEEDENIPKSSKTRSARKPPSETAPTTCGPPKPGSKSADTTFTPTPSSSSLPTSVPPPTADATHKFGLMFSGNTKEYQMNSDTFYPYIVVEVFRNADGSIIEGELKDKKTGKLHEVGGDYVDRLSEAYIVPTSAAYMYCFKHARLCPHFLLTSDEVKKYVQKLLAHGDVSIRKPGSWQHNHGPVEIVSGGTLEKELGEGKHRNSMFTFFSHTTKPYLEFCNVREMHFPLDAWMRYFDEKEAKSKKKGDKEQEKLRGLRFPFDAGWGRNGVHERRSATQKKGKEYVCAQPTLINTNTILQVGEEEVNAYETFQEPLDALASIAEKYIRDANGDPLYNDEFRDDIFGKPLREKTKCKKRGSEAFTFVRQKVNPKHLVDLGHVTSERLTKRHLDGPDSGEEGYNVTCILSFHVVHNGYVYRVTLIAYTRQSCADWIDRNNYSRYLRQALRDYKLEHNGLVSYQDFGLRDDMSEYRVRSVGSYDLHHYNVFIPPRAALTDSFYDRYRENRTFEKNYPIAEEEEPWTTFDWEHFESAPADYSLRWVDYHWNNKFQPPVKMIAVTEFINRFAYVSSYSHVMNTFFLNNRPSYDQRISILYFALLSTSPCLFSFILDRLDERLNQSSIKTLTAVQLFRKCQQISDDHGFQSFIAGPYGRYRSQPVKLEGNNPLGYKFVPTTEKKEHTPDGKLEACIRFLAKAVEELDAGDCLCPMTNKMIKNVCDRGNKENIYGVGGVSSLSFPSLCVFTGFCSSEAAIETAQQALPNVSSKNSYYPALCRYINHHGDFQIDPADKQKGKQLLQNAFFSVADSWDTCVQAIENGSCCRFRYKPHKDVFLKGMDLYDIKPADLLPLRIKKFNSDEWVPIKFEQGFLMVIE